MTPPHEPQASRPGPLVKFARFEKGKLELFTARTTSLVYYAVSHVWGNTAWLPLPAAGGDPRLISKEKAAFVADHLPGLVGDTAFWMDTLTVNQRDPAEVVATVQVIPDIFRDAALTIAVRECDGFYACCEEAVTGYADWQDFNNRIGRHNGEHFGHVRAESYLRRLWTLQECLLSHTIQFVVAPPNKPLPEDENRPFDAYAYQNDTEMVSDCLWVLAYSFSGSEGVEAVHNFTKAYMNSGTVTRTKPPRRTESENIHNIENGRFRLVNLASNRSASMPRDYIFATMTQFPWYHYPEDAVNMTFSAIFMDLYEQACMHARQSFEPRVLQAMTETDASGSNAWLPSDDQPEPACLGDFLKLMGGTTPDTPKSSSTGPHPRNSVHLTRPVLVRQYENESASTVLEIIEAAMNFSEQAWEDSHKGGDVSKFGSFPDEKWQLDDEDARRCGWQARSRERQIRVIQRGDETPMMITVGRGTEYDEIEHAPTTGAPHADLPSTTPKGRRYTPLLQHARKILAHMWCGTVRPNRKDAAQESDWALFKRSMRGSWPQPLLQTMLLLSAMVGCGIGLSADAWANRRFVPVYVGYGDEIILGLLARHARPADKSNPQDMLSVGRQLPGEHFCTDLLLVHPESLMPVGLLPDFLPHISHPSRTDELGTKRAAMLYGDFARNASPEGVEVRVVSLESIACWRRSERRVDEETAREDG